MTIGTFLICVLFAALAAVAFAITWGVVATFPNLFFKLRLTWIVLSFDSIRTYDGAVVVDMLTASPFLTESIDGKLIQEYPKGVKGHHTLFDSCGTPLETFAVPRHIKIVLEYDNQTGLYAVSLKYGWYYQPLVINIREEAYATQVVDAFVRIRDQYANENSPFTKTKRIPIRVV